MPAPVKKTAIILNPHAGSGKARKILPLLRRKLAERSISFDLQLSDNAEHATYLARRALAAGCGIIAACGGDGTTHRVTQALVGTPAVLGVIPVGRGNDFPRNLGIPEDLDSCLDVLQTGNVRQVDVVRVNSDQYMIGVGGTGFDSEVNAISNNLNGYIKGSLAYLLPALLKMLTYESKTISLELPGQKLGGPVFMVAFGNIKSYGKGMRITPLAKPDDGLLDVCWVDPIKMLRLYRFFPTVYSGKHIHLPEVRYFQTSSARVESAVPMDLYGDGEFLCRTPFSLQVLPRVLRILVPGTDSRYPVRNEN